MGEREVEWSVLDDFENEILQMHDNVRDISLRRNIDDLPPPDFEYEGTFQTPHKTKKDVNEISDSPWNFNSSYQNPSPFKPNDSTQTTPETQKITTKSPYQTIEHLALSPNQNREVIIPKSPITLQSQFANFTNFNNSNRVENNSPLLSSQKNTSTSPHLLYDYSPLTSTSNQSGPEITTLSPHQIHFTPQSVETITTRSQGFAGTLQNIPKDPIENHATLSPNSPQFSNLSTQENSGLPPLFPFASVFRLKQQISELMARLGVTERALESSEQSREVLKMDLENKNNTNLHLSQAIDFWKEQIEAILSRKDQHQVSRDYIRETALKLANLQIDKLQTDIENNHNIISQLQKATLLNPSNEVIETKILMDKINVLEDEVLRLNRDSTQAQVLHEVRGKELKNFQQMCERLTFEYDENMKNMAQEITHLRSEYERTNNSNFEMKKSGDVLVEENEELKMGFFEMQKNLTQRNEELITILKEKEEEIEGYKVTIETLSKTVDEIKNIHYKNFNQDIYEQHLRSILDNHQRQMNEMNNQLDTLKDEKKVLFDKMNEKIQDLGSELQKEIKANKQLAMELLAIKSDTNLQTILHENLFYDDEKSFYQESKESEKESDSHKLVELEIDDLKKKNEEGLLSEMKEIKKIDQVNSELENLKQERVTTLSENEKLTKELQTVTNTLHALQATLSEKDKIEEVVLELEKSCKNLEDLSEKLKLENTAINSINEKLTNDLQSITNELHSTQIKLSKKETDSKEFQKVTSELHLMQLSNKRLLDEVDSLTNKLKAIQNEIGLHEVNVLSDISILQEKFSQEKETVLRRVREDCLLEMREIVDRLRTEFERQKQETINSLLHENKLGIETEIQAINKSQKLQTSRDNKIDKSGLVHTHTQTETSEKNSGRHFVDSVCQTENVNSAKGSAFEILDDFAQEKHTRLTKKLEDELNSLRFEHEKQIQSLQATNEQEKQYFLEQIKGICQDYKKYKHKLKQLFKKNQILISHTALSMHNTKDTSFLLSEFSTDDKDPLLEVDHEKVLRDSKKKQMDEKFDNYLTSPIQIYYDDDPGDVSINLTLK